VYEVAPETLLQLRDALEVVSEPTVKPVGLAGAVENDHTEEYELVPVEFVALTRQ
jgi:hypothetical protein